MTQSKSDERLFVGLYPAGVVYADRHREKGGDYARLGFLPYDTLELRIEDGCPAHLRSQIEEDAAGIIGRRGQMLKIAGNGGGVLLGSALDPVPVVKKGTCGKCRIEGAILSDGLCLNCRVGKLSGMAYAGGKYTAYEWWQKTGVNPRFMPFDMVAENGLCYWPRKAEDLWQRLSDQRRANWAALGVSNG